MPMATTPFREPDASAPLQTFVERGLFSEEKKSESINNQEEEKESKDSMEVDEGS